MPICWLCFLPLSFRPVTWRTWAFCNCTHAPWEFILPTRLLLEQAFWSSFWLAWEKEMQRNRPTLALGRQGQTLTRSYWMKWISWIGKIYVKAFCWQKRDHTAISAGDEDGLIILDLVRNIWKDKNMSFQPASRPLPLLVHHSNVWLWLGTMIPHHMVLGRVDFSSQ